MKAIGVDIVENQRVKAMLDKHGTRFLNRVYSEQELAYCQGRIQSLAARWAAKEAMSKAFGTGIGDMAFKEIEVVNDSRGKPNLVLHGNAKMMAQERGFHNIEISLSHTDDYAVAFVVAD
ncbi:MAG: holo-ACP synthase [Chloroflexota bacterium]